jgi:glycosyltransferase involved in cell wall biosynthesis
MHILLIHQAFAAIDEPGGTRHHEFARALAGRGHKVTVIASPVSYLTGLHSNPPKITDGKKEEDESVVILRTQTTLSLHRSFVQRILAFVSFMFSSFFIGLGVKNVDLVWGTSPPIFQGVSAWLLARFKKVPFLLEVRDLWPTFAIAVGVLKNRVLIKLSLWLEQFLYHRADLVMVNSPGFVAHVTERGARQVELVPNGADPEMFEPLDNGKSFRTANHLEDNFVVTYAGAHGMSNDLGVVLEAARILQDRSTDSGVMVTFIGDGKDKIILQERAANMGLTNVLFLPPIPKTGMGRALAGANACLAILKPIEEYKTTYPNKVFDYMAAGRPIVLAIGGAIKEVIEAAGCGVIVKPGDPPALAEAILSLSVDKEKSKRMGLAGRKYLEEHFSRAQITDKLSAILERMTR